MVDAADLKSADRKVVRVQVPSQGPNKEVKMSKYEGRIRHQKSDNSFFAVIVRVDRDGEENVIHGYKGRYFSSEKAAQKSIDRYLTRHKLTPL